MTNGASVFKKKNAWAESSITVEKLEDFNSTIRPTPMRPNVVVQAWRDFWDNLKYNFILAFFTACLGGYYTFVHKEFISSNFLGMAEKNSQCAWIYYYSWCIIILMIGISLMFSYFLLYTASQYVSLFYSFKKSFITWVFIALLHCITGGTLFWLYKLGWESLKKEKNKKIWLVLFLNSDILLVSFVSLLAIYTKIAYEKKRDSSTVFFIKDISFCLLFCTSISHPIFLQSFINIIRSLFF
ncbi:hypothetical protein NEFER03_1444 [Nematocida sp. LUAm3]|nr:hypothetical protein NEFER03_1444 [Nematocida sp. LUAm3]KAI5174726.1 hypothetical protein NEFER02_0836 [Nematocida sp. LUAm2]KAI5177863.1 hypothetical protein NEFER01_1065 [Nematocida sp. LUAm1]